MAKNKIKFLLTYSTNRLYSILESGPYYRLGLLRLKPRAANFNGQNEIANFTYSIIDTLRIAIVLYKSVHQVQGKNIKFLKVTSKTYRKPLLKPIYYFNVPREHEYKITINTKAFEFKEWKGVNMQIILECLGGKYLRIYGLISVILNYVSSSKIKIKKLKKCYFKFIKSIYPLLNWLDDQTRPKVE
ncbi:hypothetical protein AGLY_005519 [Aphis glycines]|uniref:Uncharacterized protein n=1 Tax=Aphis glycines TaxID=307491 RepID=A0A6G0TV53_APHGL|nr:hypothetical protein AGLY_005519 [Aphis glycines]